MRALCKGDPTVCGMEPLVVVVVVVAAVAAAVVMVVVAVVVMVFAGDLVGDFLLLSLVVVVSFPGGIMVLVEDLFLGVLALLSLLVVVVLVRSQLLQLTR